MTRLVYELLLTIIELVDRGQITEEGQRVVADARAKLETVIGTSEPFTYTSTPEVWPAARWIWGDVDDRPTRQLSVELDNSYPSLVVTEAEARRGAAAILGIEPSDDWEVIIGEHRISESYIRPGAWHIKCREPVTVVIPTVAWELSTPVKDERVVEVLQTSGAQRIAAERERQVEAEGWTPEHDDQHAHKELVRAADAYLLAAMDPVWWTASPKRGEVPISWPWDWSWWKPSDDPVRNLEKAGALLAAEIDRLLRERESHDGT